MPNNNRFDQDLWFDLLLRHVWWMRLHMHWNSRKRKTMKMLLGKSLSRVWLLQLLHSWLLGQRNLTGCTQNADNQDDCISVSHSFFQILIKIPHGRCFTKVTPIVPLSPWCLMWMLNTSSNRVFPICGMRDPSTAQIQWLWRILSPQCDH